ncbi:MAG TPA: NUDIX domain-containing protein, partial [Candidatus Dormibacteraeota bacterium]|nr:NUDIX domain-containing protein [Candidatus Dormibacteraeota bacterium]
MSAQSAGLLVYRRRDGTLEVLLVHPGGPFWQKRDDGAWSIPKGEVGENEAGMDVARREFEEELGVAAPEGPFVPLGRVRQAGGKVVDAWAAQADVDVSAMRSNTFEIEWPPRSGKMREFPEVDRAG